MKTDSEQLGPVTRNCDRQSTRFLATDYDDWGDTAEAAWLPKTFAQGRLANEDSTTRHATSQKKRCGQPCYFGKSAAKSGCGRAITSAMMSFPPSRSTVAFPVSIAV